MPDDPRVQQLLDELMDSGSTPEEVCASCVHLLPLVRARWRQMCDAREELDAMFPPVTGSDETPPADRPVPRSLPSVPGYEVEGVLGAGGMGVVFRARHLRLNRVVALKMALAGAYALPRERERFRREAEAVAALRHPNVVSVYDVGDADGRPYFTMEFMDGGSLSQALAGTPVGAREAAETVATLAGAVDAAHRAGVVHRDLKPANVLRTADGVLKVSDFGLARRLQGEAGLTRTGTAVGTPSYMAPEQARGPADGVGPAADVYALGAILYECLTGRPPFRAESGAETIQQVIGQDPVPPSRLNRSVPRDVETICLKCLAKDPRRRYPSAAALADDLGRFVRNEPIAARPTGHVERLVRWGRRKPAAAALMGTALVLVALVLGGCLWFVKQRAERGAELRSEVGAAVTQAESLRKRYHFRESREILEQALQRLGPTGHDELRRDLKQALDDLALVEQLDSSRMRAMTLVDGRFDAYAAEPHNLETFARAGLGGPGDEPDVVAARVRASAVRAEIVAAAEDWAAFTGDRRRREWLLAVARAADPDPSRNRLRQPELWQEGPDLAKLVQNLGADELSPSLARAAAAVLRRGRADPFPVLTAAQERFPEDFWLNLVLGWLLHDAGRNDEAVSYLRAALALRPEANPARVVLGQTLYALGRVDDALRQFDRAVRLDPNFAVAHNNLGMALLQKGRSEEGLRHLEQAIRCDPERSGAAHCNLGEALLKDGRLGEALGHLKEALDVRDPDPKVPARAHTLFGNALSTVGQSEEATAHYREAIRLDPKGWAVPYYRLANSLRLKGRSGEAVDYLQQAVRLDPGYHAAAVALGKTWYEAAREAVANGPGPGPENRPNGESDQAARRHQALAWLRADLSLRAKLVGEGKGVGWDIAAWQMDPALACVRDAPGLTKLPLAERTRWQRLWADVSEVVASSAPADGPTFAAWGDWSRAADWYVQSLKRTPTDRGHFWFEYAAVSLLSGDRTGYSRACTVLVEKCSKKDGPRAYHVARACTLAPDAVAESAVPARLAEKELQDNTGKFWALTERGALAYRAGRYQDAVSFLEQSLESDPKPGRAVVNWLWLALAHHRLGKAEDAGRWLARAQVWLDQCHDGMPARAEEDFGLHLHNWLEACVLRREAEALLRPAARR